MLPNLACVRACACVNLHLYLATCPKTRWTIIESVSIGPIHYWYSILLLKVYGRYQWRQCMARHQSLKWRQQPGWLQAAVYCPITDDEQIITSCRRLHLTTDDSGGNLGTRRCRYEQLVKNSESKRTHFVHCKSTRYSAQKKTNYFKSDHLKSSTNYAQIDINNLFIITWCPFIQSIQNKFHYTNSFAI